MYLKIDNSDILTATIYYNRSVYNNNQFKIHPGLFPIEIAFLCQSYFLKVNKSFFKIIDSNFVILKLLYIIVIIYKCKNY